METEYRSRDIQISGDTFESFHNLARKTIYENGSTLCLKEIATFGAQVNVWEFDDSALILCLTQVPVMGTNVLTHSDMNIYPRTAVINPHVGVTIHATGGYIVVFYSKNGH